MTEHPLDDFDTLALRQKLAAACMSELVGRITRRAIGVDQTTDLAELGPLVMDGVIRDTRAAVRAEQDLVLRRRTGERSACRT
jgi:hypothetical protein